MLEIRDEECRVLWASEKHDSHTFLKNAESLPRKATEERKRIHTELLKWKSSESLLSFAVDRHMADPSGTFSSLTASIGHHLFVWSRCFVWLLDKFSFSLKNTCGCAVFTLFSSTYFCAGNNGEMPLPWFDIRITTIELKWMILL